MSMKLYVGNLSFQTSSADLEALFATAGTVASANVVEDRDTGRSRGFGFVEMSSREEGEATRRALTGAPDPAMGSRFLRPHQLFFALASKPNDCGSP